MCDLCDSNKQIRDDEISRINDLSQRLQSMSQFFRNVATGHVKPHSDDWQSQERLLTGLVRDLASYL